MLTTTATMASKSTATILMSSANNETKTLLYPLGLRPATCACDCVAPLILTMLEPKECHRSEGHTARHVVAAHVHEPIPVRHHVLPGDRAAAISIDGSHNVVTHFAPVHAVNVAEIPQGLVSRPNKRSDVRQRT